MPVSWQEVLQICLLGEILSIFDGNLQVKITWKVHQIDVQERSANKKKYDRCKHIDLCIAGKLRIQDQNIDMKIYKTT